MVKASRLRIVAAASGGGHWEQIMLLREAFAEHEVHYLTTNAELISRASINSSHSYVVGDCNRSTPFAALRSCARAIRFVLIIRPDIVISTGALPGLFCVIAARLIGRKAIWIDSIANVEKLSMCGTVASRVASLCLTQWEHLATERGPKYAGSVL